MELTKRLTVLMPVYNAENYLKQAIESILNQTYKDFDLLIINDGSTDKSAAIVQSFSDDRIIFIENEQNMGIVKTLNRGIDLIKGDYIVRMDSDDICLPQRFEKQLSFMDQHPAIAVAGSSIELFNDEGVRKTITVETDPKRIRTQLMFEAALKHPSVIIRTSVLKENDYLYDIEHKATEDLGLWQKLSFNHDLGNIEEVLLEYRDNEFGITRTAEKNQTERDLAHMRVYEQLFNHLNMSYTENDLMAYRNFINHQLDFSEKGSQELAQVLSQLRQHLNQDRYDINFFDKKVSTYYRNNALRQSVTFTKSHAIYKKYFKEAFHYQPQEKAKFIMKKLMNRK